MGFTSWKRTAAAKQPTVKFSRAGIVVAIAGLVLLVTVVVWYVQTAPARWLKTAERAAEAGEWEEALRWAETSLAHAPSAAAAGVAAQAASELGDWPRAAEHLGAAAELSAPADRGPLLLAQAGAWLSAGHLTPAEAALRQTLTLPDPPPIASAALVHVLELAGRRWEELPWLLQLVKSGFATHQHLLLLGNLQAVNDYSRDADRLLRADPDCLWPQLAQARVAIAREDLPQAEELLAGVVHAHPQLVEALAWQGWVWLSTGQGQRLAEWDRGLPTEANEHPLVWMVRGLRGAELGQPQAAARALWEAARLNPHHRQVHHRLGMLLSELGRPTEAELCTVRAELARQLETAVNRSSLAPRDIGLLLEVANLMERSGRIWEARSWAALVLHEQAELPAAQQLLESLGAALVPETPWTLPRSVPAAQFDLSSWPLPDLAAQATIVAATPGGVEEIPEESRRVHFRELTAEVGIQFTYFNAADPASPGMRMFEFTGGGVAAFDYDNDLWPDLYFTQGQHWPPEAPDAALTDRLFRNVEAGQAVDVTAAAGLSDTAFGQGVACGDVNNDGFVDLYVANIGPNALWLNQGDGSFQRVALPDDADAQCWTVGCMLADVDADGALDIYDLNYVRGEGVYKLICSGHVCSPKVFLPEPDRLLRNTRDGGWQNVSRDVGLPAEDGNGLGVVAIPDSAGGLPAIFLASDQTANLFLQSAQPTALSAYAETAVAAGLAYDADGTAQACMGVAVADADGNGLLDLFVTNFYEESNTLYLQKQPWLFEDSSRSARLREPSYKLLGFGTQFFDADLDGWPDLIVANGHVDDYTDQGHPFAMPPQVFANRAGVFEELPAESLGEYFLQEHLGRGLARLDWNRDGRDEFAVSHLSAPAALVVQDGPAEGHGLRLKLIGRTGCRDATGTLLQVRTPDRTQTCALVAGGGYMASNELQLSIGLGPHSRADELVIHWPSGSEQTVTNVPADAPLLIVEGRLPMRLP